MNSFNRCQFAKEESHEWQGESEKVDSIQAQYLVTEISRLHSRNYLSRFLLFFMNNPDGNLKYIYKRPTHEDHATALIRKAYKELQPAESAASKKLNQLTPKDTLIFNQELREPRRDKNLYVIIHDSDKVSLSEQVLNETEGFRKRFITACIEKEDTIKLAGFDAQLWFYQLQGFPENFKQAISFINQIKQRLSKRTLVLAYKTFLSMKGIIG